MEMKTVFSQAELMERWGYSKQSIINMEHDGRLHRLRRLPGVRYRAREVYMLDELEKEDWDKMSPFERRRLIQKIDKLQQRVSYLESRIQKFVLISAEFMNDEAMRQLNVKEE